ncbi:MAG: aspartate--tRNA ligase [Cytophagales bacterium]|nr:aspartate--tRNA ligase [Cytophagales bacterium]
MLRTHNCGELRLANATEQVTLTGWVQRVRDKGGMVWIDLRDRYGITQLMFDESKSDPAVIAKAREAGREFVLQASGEVIERYAKNDKMPTGEIEIFVSNLTILNPAKIPPFLIEDETDGGDELRMKYRYLDLRRNPVREKLQLRHRMMQEVRRYLDGKEFMEVETPMLIKSTPEGARDFLVPSRVNKGEFYALPQSPQTFKQLLMVSGFDRYFQIVKCFRDEDLRADRQPEFTQIDCEMAFIEQEDILNTFEEMVRHLFKEVRNTEVGGFERMEYADAMKLYGSDKPDIRFGMQFAELNDVAQNKGFKVFDSAELVVGICAEGCASYTRKQLDALTDFVRQPQIGAKGLVWAKYNEDGTFKSAVDKFFTQEDLKAWAEKFGAKPGDLMLILSGETNATRKQMNELRLKLGNDLGLRDPNVFKPLWVLNFPLLEWDEESQRFHAMHHPFTSPKIEDLPMLDTNPGAVRANAYDMVINGVEIGGGSIRIHDREMQQLMFKHLGFTDEEAKEQFGFLMDAFEYGAPPHGGIALGFDRLCSMFGGSESIRDYIAFPKNNSARDVMIDAPSPASNEQLVDLSIKLDVKEEK